MSCQQIQFQNQKLSETYCASMPPDKFRQVVMESFIAIINLIEDNVAFETHSNAKRKQEKV